MSCSAPSARLLRAALAAAAACAAAIGAPATSSAAPRAKAAPVLPAWDPTGNHDLAFDPGYESVAGRYRIAFEGKSGTIDVNYAADASKLLAGGVFDDFTLVTLAGGWSATGGTQTVNLADAPKKPQFTFTGAVDADHRDVSGTYVRADGYLGLGNAVTAPLVLDRQTPVNVETTFRLRFQPSMDRRGVVRSRLGDDGRELRATLDAFAGRSFDGGLVRGRVVTKKSDGTTTARIRISGKGWTVRLDGPVDADGFHAVADVSAGGFVADDVALTIPVVEGPEPPPPPPPPPPKNLLTKGVARIVAGRIEIVRESTPKKFFGKAGDLHVEFPTSDALQTVVADPSTATGASARRCYVLFGAKSYGTATAPGTVTLEIRRYSTTPGQTIEVLCTGTVADVTGRTKPVDVLLQAVVQ